MQVEKLNQSQSLAVGMECGNCWGHQEWQEQQIDKKLKRTDKTLDGFILKFVKKYL